MSALTDRRARLLASLYRVYGEAATWQPQGGGPVTTLTIRRHAGEDLASFGDSQAIVAVGELRVRKSEMPAAAKGATITILETGEVLRIPTPPRLTSIGTEWLCEPEAVI